MRCAAVTNCVALVLRHEQVVGREARLAGVDQLPVEDLLGGRVDVVVLADDRRRLAAQLERHRRQVLGRGAHHRAAGVGRAGEDQVVEGQGGELVRRHPRQHRQDVLGELRAHQLGEEAAEVLRVRRHLDHGAVAGGDDAGQRAHGQEERIVPRRDDADDALRLRDDAVAAGGEDQRHVPALRFHPLRELAARVADPVDAAEELEHLRLFRRAVAEVGVDRVGDGVGVVEQDALERVEAALALLERRVRIAEVGGALQREDALRLVLDLFEAARLGGLCHGWSSLGKRRESRPDAARRQPPGPVKSVARPVGRRHDLGDGSQPAFSPSRRVTSQRCTRVGTMPRIAWPIQACGLTG